MNCPICGELMEEDEILGYNLPSPTYDTQPDFKVEEIKYLCNECGYYQWSRSE